MVSGLPLKSQESIFHNSQRERIEPMEYTSILYCFGVPGPVDMVSGRGGALGRRGIPRPNALFARRAESEREVVNEEKVLLWSSEMNLRCALTRR